MGEQKGLLSLGLGEADGRLFMCFDRPSQAHQGPVAFLWKLVPQVALGGLFPHPTQIHGALLCLQSWVAYQKVGFNCLSC